MRKIAAERNYRIIRKAQNDKIEAWVYGFKDGSYHVGQTLNDGIISSEEYQKDDPNALTKIKDFLNKFKESTIGFKGEVKISFEPPTLRNQFIDS